ncbi:hypothetical protein MRX96_046556 [Rhipicephalus microplus]
MKYDASAGTSFAGHTRQHCRLKDSLFSVVRRWTGDVAWAVWLPFWTPPDVVGWADAPGDTLRPAVGFFSRWARVDDDGVTCYGGDASGRRTATRWRDDDRRAAGRRTVAFASGAEDSASASEPDRPLLNMIISTLMVADGSFGHFSLSVGVCVVSDVLICNVHLTTPYLGLAVTLPIMKHDSWTLSKFRWRKEKKSEVSPRKDNSKAPEKTPQPTLVSQMDPGVDPTVVARYKRNRYMDRKFLQKPKLAEDVGPDDFGSALFGSRVSLRTLAPTAPDAASLHTTAAAAATGPPLVPFLPPRSVLRGSFGRYQGPLSQWQIAADMYIDSDIRKRGRRKVVSHSSGEAKAPMAPVERVERRQDRPPGRALPSTRGRGPRARPAPAPACAQGTAARHVLRALVLEGLQPSLFVQRGLLNV